MGALWAVRLQNLQNEFVPVTTTREHEEQSRMNSASVLHAAPSVGFDEPFEMLHACHQRVERMLTLMERLAAHVVQHGPDEQARSAAADVIRYFDQAAPHHHKDEELHVLPVLRHGSAAQRALAARLEDEHRRMEAAWPMLRQDLLQLGAGELPDVWPTDPLSPIPAAWRAFVDLYRDHVEAEELEAYPACREAMCGETAAAMGEEMARRRGVR